MINTDSNIDIAYIRQTLFCVVTASVLFVLISSFLASPVYARSLVFTTGDWPPYIYQQAETVDPVRPGFSVEITNEIFRRQGYAVSYITAPFLRQIKNVGLGKQTALVGVFREEAPELVFPSESVGISLNCFFTLKDNKWQYQSLESLQSAVITVIGGYDYGEIESYIQQAGKGVVFLTGDEAKMMQRMTSLVDNGRVTAFVQDTMVAEYYFQSVGKNGYYRQAGCLQPQDVMVGFSPKHPEANVFARKFDLYLQQMRANGDLGRILKKYGVKDWR